MPAENAARCAIPFRNRAIDLFLNEIANARPRSDLGDSIGCVVSGQQPKIGGDDMVTLGRVFFSWASLLLIDVLSIFGHRRVYAFIRRVPSLRRSSGSHAIASWVWASEEASIWYFKRVYCLQRSLALTAVLRLVGVRAELVIGFRPLPIDSHAWVEVDGAVVNDRPQYQQLFSVLDRV
jgi:hypothetical protein